MPSIESLKLPERPEMDFTLVRNGMDYLSSAVLYLTGKIQVPIEAWPLWPEAAKGPVFSQPAPLWLSDRHLKYGVLHLQAATEVLLKARLVREHWSLVFKDPGSATRADYEQGKFKSCDTATALSRLTGIVGLPITAKERKYINDLGETRNALTHYGDTANAYLVEARAARVLGFLVDFVPRHLHPALSRDAEFVATTMEAVREELRHISALVRNRMQDLADELAPVSEATVHCPSCRQVALVVGGGAAPVTCRFCLRVFVTPTEAAAYYWNNVLDADDSLGVQDCPACDVQDVVVMASTAADLTTDAPLCFHCGTVYEEK
ncbi:hypothetical protein ACFT38_28365 [Streptomyces sp. NPDC056975]|uniref:hypothetical protein n=1 Tax=Streptomyces sp. NPDC056975 TaxID=3345985 RepID=UPI00363B6EAC